jgi:multicomponent Na+:H+ antiporter subunit C
MTTFSMFAMVGIVLLGMGLYSLMTDSHLVKKILALNVCGGGIFLFLVALAAQTPAEVPDPVPHAMVLTGIVVAVSTTAVALALVCRIYELTGKQHLDGHEPE